MACSVPVTYNSEIRDWMTIRKLKYTAITRKWPEVALEPLISPGRTAVGQRTFAKKYPRPSLKETQRETGIKAASFATASQWRFIQMLISMIGDSWWCHIFLCAGRQSWQDSRASNFWQWNRHFIASCAQNLASYTSSSVLEAPVGA